MTLQPVKLKPYLLLLVILLLAFLPVSTFHFGMKNDAFSDNFPNKFFFTEAIRSGFFPLWNPYLNFGFPIYADPGFAFWNPITWFFGAAVGYNAYTLTIEVLLYIYIAGVTMYRLGRYLNFTSVSALAVASMYMCSGFFAGELQHINFLTSAAFLPFLVQKFLSLFCRPDYKNAFLTSIAYYFVFAGGHPAIPVGTIYFLLALSISIFIFNKKARQNWKKLLQFHLFAVFIFILLYSPAIYSYVSIINYYARDRYLNQLNEIRYGFSPTSYLSFLYPFATAKDASFLTDDLSMRNVYFSLAGFAFLMSQLKNKNYLIRSFLICGAIMLLLSSGGYIKAALYSSLPFLKYIRTNGEYRVFSILCFCIIAGYGLNKMELHPQESYLRFRRVLKILLPVSLLLFFYALLTSYSDLRNFAIPAKAPVTAIKFIMDNITFNNALLISTILNIACILALFAAKANTKKIVFIIITDLVINSIAYLPFSGVGTITLSEIQNTYNKSKKGIIKPSLTPLKDIDTFSLKKAGLVGSSSFYNKKIGITKLTDYPSYFSTTKAYFISASPDTINCLPYIFLKKNVSNYFNHEQDSDTALIVDFFSPQKINIKVNVSQRDSLVFLQNYYKFWKAKIDDHVTPVNKSHITFMSVPLNKGNHLVEIYYADKWLPLFVILSISTFITIIIYIFRRRFIRNMLFLQPRKI